LDTINYTYDDLGRLVRVEYVDKKVFYDFSYDKSGNRTLHKVSGSNTLIRLWNTRVLEGGWLSFGVWLTQPSADDVTVDWEVVPDLGTNPATSPQDYSTLFGTVTIPAGAQEASISILTVDDALIEPSEQVYVKLTNPKGAPLDPLEVQKVGTIRDNDGVFFNVADVTVSEGGLATLVVERQGALGDVVTVAIETTDFTSFAAVDYEPTIYNASNQPLVNGEVVFGANELSKTILVQTIGEDMFELDEYFWVDFSWTVAGIGGWERAAINIPNDDPLPVIHVSNSGNREGSAVEFGVWLSNASYAPIDVTYQIDSNGSNTEGYPNATTGDDYNVASTLVTGSVNVADASSAFVVHSIAPGESNLTLAVPTVSDAVVEPIFEAFYVKILSATGATVDTVQGASRGRIRDDDQDVTMTAAGVTVDEGNGSSNAITIPVTLSAAGKGSPNTTVDWVITGGTAVLGTDYTGATSGTVAIPFGETYGEISLTTVPNSVYADDKTIVVTFSNWVDASYLGGVDVTSTIRNDDAQPAYFAVTAGNDLESVLDRAFTITRSGDTAIAATVNYAITPDTAVYTEDYVAKAGYALTGTLSFGANETSKQVFITVVDDDIWEQRDDVRMTLSAASAGAVISTATADIGIGNDDGTPIINIFNTIPAEGNNNNVINMTVFLQGGTMHPVTVTVKTTDGSAVAGQDYVAVPSYTVTIPARQFSATVPITILGDTTVESDETINLEVVSYTNALTVTTGVNAANPNKGSNGVATLVNDDVAITYTWNSGSWGSYGACQPDNKKYRSRTVTCKRSTDNATVNNSNCNSGTKPVTTSSTSCTYYTYSWSYGSYGGWSACTGQSTQSRTRSATCTRTPGGAAVSGSYCSGSASTTDTRACTYSYQYGTWGSYGACQSNGTKTRTRSATCKSSTGHTVNNSNCGTAITTSTTTCTPITYSWSYGAWGSWPACTGQTVRYKTRTASCVSSAGGTVSGSYCSGTADTTRSSTCSYTYAWNTGAWSGWTCLGVGDAAERTRAVTCQRSPDGATVSDGSCGGTKPVTYEIGTSTACGGSGGF